ncbi:hypothetical protein CK203_021702 [Vitis vinifera]|uniref:Uncharacterized protein n=1 Tax=Vitis vinifera TaxID=29760 RepID=A0A438J4F0_VITVI|nr:hypothetical protein CK203_021702 [Vitis vinifera]
MYALSTNGGSLLQQIGVKLNSLSSCILTQFQPPISQNPLANPTNCHTKGNSLHSTPIYINPTKITISQKPLSFYIWLSQAQFPSPCSCTSSLFDSSFRSKKGAKLGEEEGLFHGGEFGPSFASKALHHLLLQVIMLM